MFHLINPHIFSIRSPSPDLLSDDMRRERERKKWEEQAEQEVGLDEPVGPIHYQAVHGGEIRSHGIGYYAFSTDESKRKEQMELLDKLRKQVILAVFLRTIMYSSYSHIVPPLMTIVVFLTLCRH